MRRRPPPPSCSPSSSDESDIGSCFDIKDRQDVDTDVDTDVEDTGPRRKSIGANDADLMSVDTDIEDADLTDIDTDYEGCDIADLSLIAGEGNAYPPEYYQDQENQPDESGDEDEDYSDGSLLLLDMIEAQFNRYILYTLLSTTFHPQIINLTPFKDTANMYERSRPRPCWPSLATASELSSIGC